MRRLFRQVPVLDTGARGATTASCSGDWGCAARLGERGVAGAPEFGHDKFEIVYPSVSILRGAAGRAGGQRGGPQGDAQLAQALSRLPVHKEGQEIAAKNYYRPRDPEVAARYAERYPPVRCSTSRTFGGWDEAQAKYFADGGLFDRIYHAGTESARIDARRLARRSPLPGFGRTLGLTLVWVCLIVLLPLAALALRPWELGFAGSGAR